MIEQIKKFKESQPSLALKARNYDDHIDFLISKIEKLEDWHITSAQFASIRQRELLEKLIDIIDNGVNFSYDANKIVDDCVQAINDFRSAPAPCGGC